MSLGKRKIMTLRTTAKVAAPPTGDTVPPAASPLENDASSSPAHPPPKKKRAQRAKPKPLPVPSASQSPVASDTERERRRREKGKGKANDDDILLSKYIDEDKFNWLYAALRQRETKDYRPFGLTLGQLEACWKTGLPPRMFQIDERPAASMEYGADFNLALTSGATPDLSITQPPPVAGSRSCTSRTVANLEVSKPGAPINDGSKSKSSCQPRSGLRIHERLSWAVSPVPQPKRDIFRHFQPNQGVDGGQFVQAPPVRPNSEQPPSISKTLSNQTPQRPPPATAQTVPQSKWNLIGSSRASGPVRAPSAPMAPLPVRPRIDPEQRVSNTSEIEEVPDEEPARPLDDNNQEIDDEDAPNNNGNRGNRTVTYETKKERSQLRNFPTEVQPLASLLRERILVRAITEHGFADVVPAHTYPDANGKVLHAGTLFDGWVLEEWPKVNNIMRPGEPPLELYAEYKQYAVGAFTRLRHEIRKDIFCLVQQTYHLLPGIVGELELRNHVKGLLDDAFHSPALKYPDGYQFHHEIILISIHRAHFHHVERSIGYRYAKRFLPIPLPTIALHTTIIHHIISLFITGRFILEKMNADKQKCYFEYYLDSLLHAMREVDENNQPVMSYRKRTTTLVNKWFEYCYQPKQSILPPKKRTRRVYESDDEEAYVTSIAVADGEKLTLYVTLRLNDNILQREVEDSDEAEIVQPAQPAHRPAVQHTSSRRESPPQAGPSGWRSYRRKCMVENDEDSD
ncbi:hypothetical protein FRC09_017656 [Ceratobasidium sp. 395]|nr:hypothetical protein FRC09_017656 [Ceratobasidium sp. 395]